MTKQQRELTVLKRAECKKASKAYGVQAGDLIFLVKNDKEDVHETILRNNGKHSCTCKAGTFGRKCYHITYCEGQANIRRESAKVAPSFAAKSVPVWAMWLLESGVLALPKQVVEMPAQVVESPTPLREWVDHKISTQELVNKTVLTQNNGFSILKRVG
jgi:hypothetical protein